MLKYKDDLRPLSITFYTFVSLLFSINYNNLNFFLIFIIFLNNILFTFFSATIIHNTIHHPLFKSTIIENIFSLFLSIIFGYPIITLVPGHNLSHHKYTELAEDYMRTTKMRYKNNLLNFIFFVPSVSRRIGIKDYKYLQQNKKKFILFKLQVLSILIFYIWLMVNYSLNVILFYIIIPQLSCKYGLISINLLQHDGCYPRSEKNKYNIARNFTGNILNYFTCNNGYHTIHHIMPGKHWSLLPSLHQEFVEPFIHPNLNQPSIINYFYKTYILPNGRKKYDGSSYNLSDFPDIEDKEWVV